MSILGAVIGDVVGSRFERHNIKTKEFELFAQECRPTDDSIMTLAIAEAVMDWDHENLEDLSTLATMCMQKWGRWYPDAGYGGTFIRWLKSSIPEPYNSWGNGAAMRVSPCAYAANSLEEALEMAKAVTEVTHNHPEGMKGAQATTAAIYLALHGSSKQEIRDRIVANYYPMNFTLDEIRDDYTFDVSCQGTVPQAIEAFLESDDFEDAIRNAISIGGDSDTIAAITGSTASAYYGIPADIKAKIVSFLDSRMLTAMIRFDERLKGRNVKFERPMTEFESPMTYEWFTKLQDAIASGDHSRIFNACWYLYRVMMIDHEYSHYCELMKVIRSTVGEDAFYGALSML